MQRAKEIGIKGRSTMSKQQLIKALRDHSTCLVEPGVPPMSMSVEPGCGGWYGSGSPRGARLRLAGEPCQRPANSPPSTARQRPETPGLGVV